MTTIKIHAPAQWATSNQVKTTKFWNNITTCADAQAANRTLWFMVSLIVQGVLFLPVPAALIYFYDAPVIILAVTLILFFANIIAGMSGAGIRSLLFLFAFSVITHLTMLVVFML